jgi:hypothetical protein
MISRTRVKQHTGLMAALMIVLFCTPIPGLAQTQPEKTFHAVVTDTKGVETDVNNIFFYWEEKLSETAFVPNELREVPVTRGTATVKVKFETIKQIDIRKGSDGAQPVLAITLTNGKTGEFTLAIDGTFRGESDFGEVEFKPTGLSKIIFK